MGLALKVEDFNFIPESPPEFGRALEVAVSVSDFAKLVDDYQRSSLVWRTKLRTGFIEGLKNIEDKISGADDADVREGVFAPLDRVSAALEGSIEKFSVPFHDRPEVPGYIAKAQSRNPKVARILRKQIDRIEDIRIAQYNICVELLYALLAFKSRYEDGRDEGETFSHPDDLAAFLKSQVA